MLIVLPLLCLSCTKSTSSEVPNELVSIVNDGSLYSLATVSAMTKVLPKKTKVSSIDFSLAKISLQGARGEMEAKQVIIYSPVKQLEKVKLLISPLQNDSGEIISEDVITADPVGYVKTSKSSFPEFVAGWWPDPILSDLKEFDVNQNDLQAIWYSVRIPYGTASGIYRGTLQIIPGNAPASEVLVELEVWDFDLPKSASLSTALYTAVYTNYYFEDEIEQWAKRYGVRYWQDIIKGASHKPARLKELERKFDDFLFDHRCNPGGIYGSGPIGRERLEYWKQRNITDFCAGYIPEQCIDSKTNELTDEAKAEIQGVVAPVIAVARELDIVDRAYIYVFDECSPDKKHEKAVQWAKKCFPDVRILTTIRDKNYGIDGSVVPSIDMFCPLTPDYIPEQVRKARAIGKRVWWYVCCNPRPPYANTFVDSTGIETRLLLGFMSYAYQVDGFLYYRMMSSWNNEKKYLIGGPYTDWNPDSYEGINGDGHLIYPGPNGPISSIRMENWLDGLEDYEYLKLLEKSIQQFAMNGDKVNCVKAEKLLKKLRPEKHVLFKDLKKYTKSPEELLEVRQEIGILLSEFGE